MVMSALAPFPTSIARLVLSDYFHQSSDSLLAAGEQNAGGIIRPEDPQNKWRWKFGKFYNHSYIHCSEDDIIQYGSRQLVNMQPLENSVICSHSNNCIASYYVGCVNTVLVALGHLTYPNSGKALGDYEV